GRRPGDRSSRLARVPQGQNTHAQWYAVQRSGWNGNVEPQRLRWPTESSQDEAHPRAGRDLQHPPSCAQLDGDVACLEAGREGEQGDVTPARAGLRPHAIHQPPSGPPVRRETACEPPDASDGLSPDPNEAV